MKKFIALSVSTFFLCFSITTLSKDNMYGYYLDENESLKQLSNGSANTPEKRLGAKVKFHKSIKKKNLIDWVESLDVEVLELKGKLNIGGNEYTVFLNDIGGYKGSFDEILDAQINIYHANAINDLVEKSEKKLNEASSTSIKEHYRKIVSNFKLAKNQEIYWTEAKVISRYSILYKIANSDTSATTVIVDKVNNAPLYDKIMSAPGIKKRTIDDIKDFSYGETPSLKSVSQSDSNIRQHSQGSLSHYTKAEAAGTLCGGNKPRENYCPPDANYEPDYPYWYVYIEARTDDNGNEVILGKAQTVIDWDGNELDALTNSSLAHCSPLLTGTSANCRTSLGLLQEDVIYVPDGTFEQETSIPNPSCFGRTGNSTTDYYLGCFTPYYVLSNLPSAYLDTTVFDDDDLYSATVGTFDGEQLSASVDYSNLIYFHTEGETIAALTGKIVNTYGQIGTRIPSSCYDNLCVFGVDTSAVIDSAPLLPVQ